MSLANRTFGVLVSVIIILACLGQGEPLFGEQAKTVSARDFINGVIFEDMRIPFFSNAITDTLKNDVDFNDILMDHQNFLVAYSAPHICGGCAVHDMALLNTLASSYPDQVLFIVQNPFYKETMKAIRNVRFGDGVRVLLDTDGKNIEKFSRLSDKFYDAWLFIINKDNNIVYSRALTYEDKVSSEYRSWFTKYALEMLSRPRELIDKDIPKLY